MKIWIRTFIDCVIVSAIIFFIEYNSQPINHIEWKYVFSPFWVLGSILMIEIFEGFITVTFHFFRGLYINRKRKVIPKEEIKNDVEE